MKIGGQRIPGKTLLLITSEAALIGFGLLLATALRFFRPDAIWNQLVRPGTATGYAVVIIVCEFSLYYYDLYDLQIVSRRSVLFVRLLQALGTACLILALVYFFYPDLTLGRGIAALGAPIIITLVLGWRLLVDASAPIFRRSDRILIVGTGRTGLFLANEVLGRPELNIELVGFLQDGANVAHAFRVAEVNAGTGETVQVYEPAVAFAAATPACSPIAVVRPASIPASGHGAAAWLAAGPVSRGADPGIPRVLGKVGDVGRVAASEQVDRVVLALPERRGIMPVTELLQLKFMGVKIEEAHTLYERLTGRILLDHLSPSWLILSEGFRKPRLLSAMKRFMDVIFSAVALILSIPIMAMVALAVYVETGSPILFRQARIGQHERLFEILKFRSMRNVPQQRANWTADEDERVTRVGRFIRRFRLDELPQFINVLRGDMSLVGPRPEQPSLVVMLEEQIPYYAQRHSLRPGITGWAQVKYGYGATIEQARIKLEHDLFYIKHMSLALDLAIIFETGKVLLSGRGAK